MKKLGYKYKGRDRDMYDNIFTKYIKLSEILPEEKVFYKYQITRLKAMNTKCDSCGCDSNVKLIGQGPYKKGKKGTIQDYGYKYKCPHCGVVRILHYDPLIDPSELRLECDQCKTLLEMKDVVNTIEVYRW